MQLLQAYVHYFVLLFLVSLISGMPGYLSATPVPTLQLRSRWSEVFVSETVELECSIAGSSDWTFTWSKDNVPLSADTSVLTVTAQDQNDAGHYSCRGLHKTTGNQTAASNSVTIKVHGGFFSLSFSPENINIL